MATFFDEHFGVTTDDLDRHGAFNISVINDMPLFIDPFLLFNSKKPEYQDLHDSILKYLMFLRDAVDRQTRDTWPGKGFVSIPRLSRTGSVFPTRKRRKRPRKGLRFGATRYLRALFIRLSAEKFTKGSHIEVAW